MAGGCLIYFLPFTLWNVLKNLLLPRLPPRCLVGVNFVETSCGFRSAVAPALFISHYLFNLFSSTPSPLPAPLYFLAMKPSIGHGVTYFVSITYLIWPFPGCWRLPLVPRVSS